MGIDYYAVLSVKRNASIWEIKMAYRALALRLHPQREQYQQHPHPRPAGVFDLPLPSIPENIYWELVNEAYDVLSNELRREIYNHYGEEGLKRGVAAPNGFIPPYRYHNDCMRTYFEFFGSYSPYADIIDAVTKPPPLYNVNQGRGVVHKDPDVINLLPLTLENVFHGCLKNFDIKRKEFIDELKSKTETKEVTLSIQVKPGTLAGTRIIFHNAGDQSVTRLPSDYVYITCDEPHRVFRRDTFDLHMNYKISLKEALTGFKMSIRTLDDRSLSVLVTDVVEWNSGENSSFHHTNTHNTTACMDTFFVCCNYIKVLKSEGLPYFENPQMKGDLIVHFEIKFPGYIPRVLRESISDILDEVEEFEQSQPTLCK